jgi:hypothetical protein
LIKFVVLKIKKNKKLRLLRRDQENGKEENMKAVKHNTEVMGVTVSQKPYL